MQIKNLEVINNFVKKLGDGESEKLFDARFDYLIYRDTIRFYEKLDNILQSNKREYAFSRTLNSYYKRNPQNKEKNIVIFGAGECGKTTCRSLLYLAGEKIKCICDNNESFNGKYYKNIPIRNFSYICKNFKNCIVIVSVSDKYQSEIYYQLILAGFRENDILMVRSGKISCDILNQYFDSSVEGLLPDMNGEYFVDAGCFNGETSLECSNWCNGNLKMIYAFEPDRDNYMVCDKRLKKLGNNYELYECATWSGAKTLKFNHAAYLTAASSISNSGSICVSADSIDNKLRGRKATYIKMDVEGSELESLKGSVKTILEYRPKLAISLYHKPEDIIAIPAFLESLRVEYKYFLRQYRTNMGELVLYAL